jgi:predicted O-methyltransferase YrrM
MSNKTLNLSTDLYDYLLSVSLRETDILRELRYYTANYSESNMQIAPEQGQFLSLLLKLVNAKRVIEVGVFTGYSSLWMALALPENGKVIACDINEDWTNTAKAYWKRAGVLNKIDLHIAPALSTLDGFIADGQVGEYDFIFIDADKVSYDDYYERSLLLLRVGGLIVIDNTLWDGMVIDLNCNDPDTIAIRAINKKLLTDDRIILSFLPVADGLTLALKR